MKEDHFKITLRRIDMKSLALFLWLTTRLYLAAVRFVLVRLGVPEGMMKETVLTVVTCVPYVFLALGLSREKDKGQENSVAVFLLLFLSTVLAFLLSLGLNPALSTFYFRDPYGIYPVFRPDGAIYGFLFFAVMDDPKELKKVLVHAAYVLLFFQLVVVFLPVLRRGYWIDIAPNGEEDRMRYSLSFGYDLLLLMIIFITEGVKTKKLRFFILSILCIALFATNGGRGAVVMFVVFLVLWLLISIPDQTIASYKKILLLGGLSVAAAGILLFWKDLTDGLLSTLKSLNLNSRNLDMILRGTFSSSNGRSMIWGNVIEAIKNGGLFGYGMFGERPFVVSIHVAGYSHNLFLELISGFAIIGLLISLYIIVDSVRMLFFSKDKEWKMLFFILFAGSLKLLLSFSIWYDWEIWAAVAVAYQYKRSLRVKRAGLACRERIHDPRFLGPAEEGANG